MVCYWTTTCFITKRVKHIRILDGFKNGSLVTVSNSAGALRLVGATHDFWIKTKKKCRKEKAYYKLDTYINSLGLQLYSF